MADRFETHNGTIPGQPSRFADDIQQLFGDAFDPDPLFLEESWTLGIPAAAENLRRRRQSQADREHQSRAFRELDNLGSLFFIEHDGRAAEALFAGRAAMIASQYSSTWSERPAPTPASSTCDLEQRLGLAGRAPDDHIAHSWIPQAGVPAGPPQQKAVPQQAESFSELSDSVTVARAHQLLGTTMASTREQIRSAYRRKVSEWHPDRLQCATYAVRECATQQMAAINEAYRMLRSALLHDAA